jgi:hypothetical protein
MRHREFLNFSGCCGTRYRQTVVSFNHRPVPVMIKFFQSSHLHVRTPRLMPHSSTMQAVYSTSTLRQANAMPFKSLAGKLDPGILTALDAMQYEYMTPVQEKVLGSLPTLRTDW